MPSCKFDVDDRGNVVDFYCNDEQTGRIDREAGDDANSLYAWFSDSATEKWARENGWADVIDRCERD